MKYYTPLNTRRVQSINEEPSMTKQEFKDDCDPTLILKKYAATGMLEHSNQYAPVYGEQSSLTYHEARQLTAAAETQFQDLPSDIRKRFNHDVGQWLDFIENDLNQQDVADDGIINSSSTPKATTAETTAETTTAEAVTTP